MRQEGVLFLLFMFIMMTNLVIFYLILSSFSIKRTLKYSLLTLISLTLGGVFLAIGIDSVVMFFNNLVFKVISTLASTMLIYLHVLRPWMNTNSNEDKQVALIFKGMVFVLILLTAQATIFSLGMIVHEGNLISLSK